jgi:hypothetical protein
MFLESTARPVRRADNLTAICLEKWRTLNISQPYRPPQPVTGIALLFYEWCVRMPYQTRNVIPCVMTEVTVKDSYHHLTEIIIRPPGHTIPRLLLICKRKYVNFRVMAILSCIYISCYLTTPSILRLYRVRWQNGWIERLCLE